MGLCLSCRGGEAQHKAAVVAVSISHHAAASPARPSRTLTDSSTATHPSLKRFLHVYNEGSDQSRKVFSGSPRPSLEDSQLVIPHSSELFSLPSEGSENESDGSNSPSPARASYTSFRAPSSSPRSSPRRRSSASLGGNRSVGRFSTEKPPIPPRGSNARAPARKSCSSLGQVAPHKSLVETIARLEKFCDVKLFLENRSCSNSNSRREFSTASGHESTTSILLHESWRDFAQKLLCFANEHADGFLSKCDADVKLDLAACVTSDSCGVREKETDPVGASFLAELEFADKVGPAEPAGEASVMSRLPSLRFHDADENIQFTDFEATFELLSSEGSVSHRSIEAGLSAGASISAENSAPRLDSYQPAHRRSRTSSDLGGVPHVKASQQEGPKKPNMFRSVLTDISPNVTPADEPLGRKNHRPLKPQTPTGVLKRGSSRSLDLQGCSPSQLEFDIFSKSERWQSPQGEAEALCREESQRLEAEESQRLEAEESQRLEVADSPTIKQLAGEEEGNAPSQSVASVPSQSQPTKGRVSADEEEEEEERIPEAAGAADANVGDETPNIQDIADKSLSAAFDNLFKLLQSPPGELAQNTSHLLHLLEAKSNTRESSADGAHISDATQIARESPADRPLVPSREAESRHDASASLSTTEQPELPARHSTAGELDCLPEALLSPIQQATQRLSNMES